MAVKPKLAMIPSGYKGGASSGDLYSVLPSDGTGDFDFSRSGSATRINKDGLIETVDSNVPRLNYPLIDGVVSGCPSLLLEPQRINLIEYSEDFNNSAWIKQAGITVSDNNIISPDGTLNADKITTTNSNIFMYDVLSLTPSTEYTVSFYIKNDNSKKTRIWGAGEIPFDMTWNGSQLVSINQGSFEYFGNEWYKVSVTQTSQSDGQYITRIYPNVESVTTNSIYLWGFQVEEGSYGTSYIKSNSGSATTRSAETCNNSGDVNTFNDSEGVLMVEASALNNDGTFRNISLASSGVGYIDTVSFSYNPTDNQITFVYRVGSTSEVIMNYTLADATEINKIAFKYKVNDFALWVDGIEVDTDTSNSNMLSSGTLSRLTFSRSDTLNPFYGNTKQIQYYNSVLTESELEELTSWVSFTDMAESQLYSIE